MELALSSFALPFLLLVLTGALSILVTLWDKKKNLPPSPGWALPLIGHLHLITKQPHRSLQALSKKYGPIMFLKLGMIPSIIVSSPEMAKEALMNNGLAFASRPYLLISEIIGYDFQSIGIHYSEHSRRLRKMCVTELIAPQKLESSLWVRFQELSRAFRILRKSNEEKVAVDMRYLFSTFTFNAFTMILMSKRYFGDTTDDNDQHREIKHVINEIFSLAIKFHITEFVPSYLRCFLEWLDPTIPQFKRLHERQDKFMKKIIKEHKEPTARPKDFMDALLESFSAEDTVKAFITELLLASDSTAVAAEWVMAQLLHNPHVLEKAQLELNLVVGPNRLVQESDFSKLEYLQAIIKETLRLCPPGPLLIPRSSDEACTIGGYYVPKGSTLFVNAFAIGRDPSIWESPTEFMPERFLGRSVDFKGQHFDLIPFGSGRRMCPGMPLALKALELLLANLVHGFDWSFPPGEIQTLEDCFETTLLLNSFISQRLRQDSLRKQASTSSVLFATITTESLQQQLAFKASKGIQKCKFTCCLERDEVANSALHHAVDHANRLHKQNSYNLGDGFI
ncbi:cytochrome P450 CYP736A12 [Selaginella moellendorffii]|nr:cytochrome P450 CYP736A12 [Selaginella moellendorffii]|eukprot:XP_002990813.2 cytochrome P450 CYP736A12 [Selaginella moellendorffii]